MLIESKRPSSAPSALRHSRTSHRGMGSPAWHSDVSTTDRLYPKERQDQPLIFVVMGLTGSGKSTFINEVLNKNVMDVGHGLKSCTQQVEYVTITLPKDHETWPNRSLVLVDTPGFDDSRQGEFEILRTIAVWLASAYDSDTKIAGLIYLQNIGNVRVGGMGLLSYDIFHRICGPNALSRVLMATTHWGAVSEYPEAGRIREQELQTEFWSETLAQGACYKRIPTRRHARGIIEYMLAKQFEAVPARIQEELVVLDMRVAQTEAGRRLDDTVQRRLMVPPS